MAVMSMFFEGPGGVIVARDGGVVARVRVGNLTLDDAQRIMRVTLAALKAEFGGDVDSKKPAG